MFNVRPDQRRFGFHVQQPEDPSSAAIPGSTMFNVRPELHLPGLHDFKPPEEVVPGFRMNANSSTSGGPAPATQPYRHVDSNPLDLVDPQSLATGMRELLDGASGPAANATEGYFNRTADPEKIQPINLPPRDGIPGAANDNRFHVCAEAAHACIQNIPLGATQMRGACMTAEEACNYALGLTRNGPFPSTVIVSFPDGGRVIIPRGSTGGGQFIPAPRPSQPSGR
jgi:hypothetical protein